MKIARSRSRYSVCETGSLESHSHNASICAEKFGVVIHTMLIHAQKSLGCINIYFFHNEPRGNLTKGELSRRELRCAPRDQITELLNRGECINPDTIQMPRVRFTQARSGLCYVLRTSLDTISSSVSISCPLSGKPFFWLPSAHPSVSRGTKTAFFGWAIFDQF